VTFPGVFAFSRMTRTCFIPAGHPGYPSMAPAIEAPGRQRGCLQAVRAIMALTVLKKMRCPEAGTSLKII